MSWAQIRTSINSNLGRALDLLITERADRTDNNMAALSARVARVETLTAKQEAVVSNVVRSRLGTNVLLSGSVGAGAIASLRTRVFGRYRIIVGMERISPTVQPGLRVVHLQGGSLNTSARSDSVLNPNVAIPDLVLDFTGTVNATYHISASREALPNIGFRIVRLDVCYNLENVNNDVVAILS